MTEKKTNQLKDINRALGMIFNSLMMINNNINWLITHCPNCRGLLKVVEGAKGGIIVPKGNGTHWHCDGCSKDYVIEGINFGSVKQEEEKR